MNIFPLSPSRINAFDCHFYFFKHYIEGVKEDEALLPVMLHNGRFQHKVIEIYNKELVKNKLNSDLETLENITFQNHPMKG